MKKIFYLFLILSLAFGLQSCGGSGGSADDPEPGPEPGAPKAKVSFALKSDINGVQDNDLKTALTHLRLYLRKGKFQKLIKEEMKLFLQKVKLLKNLLKWLKVRNM